MPADIRSFFGAKSSQGSDSSPAKPPAKKEVCNWFVVRGYVIALLIYGWFIGSLCIEKEAYALYCYFKPTDTLTGWYRQQKGCG